MIWKTNIRKNLKKYKHVFYFFIPTAIFLSITTYIPMIQSISSSFYNMREPFINIKFVGLYNYIYMLNSDDFVYSLYLTLAYTIITVPSQILLGLATALLLNSWLFKKSAAIKGLFLIGYAMPPIATGIVFRQLFSYGPEGLINNLLETIGFNRLLFLADKNLAFLTITFAEIWKWHALATLLFLAALQGIPKVLYEMAEIDGADIIKKFRYVTLPNLKFVLALMLTLRTTFVLQHFDQAFGITFGGPAWSTTLLSAFIYRLAFERRDWSKAGAVGVMLFLLTMVGVACYLYVTREQ